MIPALIASPARQQMQANSSSAANTAGAPAAGTGVTTAGPTVAGQGSVEVRRCIG
jgi:hypothetical protein